ncbi:hypothetical protein GCM10023189_46050 [Nibrella saemangeumensis]|uniref:Two component regulator propeller n=2 Tax=Nibrella saemangeumensis TaxID=1084526 RepID=A0ABP8NGJ8_9BACT
MLQHCEGFMWIGTFNGLNRYDGYTFTVFKPDPDDPEHSLQHYIITDIHEDRQGQLWVAKFGGGLNLIDRQTRNVTAYGIKSVRLDPWNTLTSIYGNSEGIFWVPAGKGYIKN